MSRFIALFFVLAVFLAGTAAVATPNAFGPLPTMDKGATDLRLRVVEYNGGTNGKMVVEIKNSGAKAEEFIAKGIYFVPKGDPERAPQRLGAAGPFQAQIAGKWERHEKLQIDPSQILRLQLDVFCIDSHRSSPNSKTQFDLAGERLPKELASEIDRGTRHLMKEKQVGRALDARSSVQSLIWKTRNKKWRKLQGERADEKSSKKSRHPRQRRGRRIHQQEIQQIQR